MQRGNMTSSDQTGNHSSAFVEVFIWKALQIGSSYAAPCEGCKDNGIWDQSLGLWYPPHAIYGTLNVNLSINISTRSFCTYDAHTVKRGQSLEHSLQHFLSAAGSIYIFRCIWVIRQRTKLMSLCFVSSLRMRILE